MASRLSWWVLCVAGVMVGCDQNEPPTSMDIDADQAAAATAEAVAEAIELPEYLTLHDLMEDMDRSYKFLRRNAHKPDADAAEVAGHIARMRAQVEVSKTMTPHEVSDAPADQQAKLADLYQEHLGRIGPALDKLEAAIALGDADAIKAAVSGVHDTEEHGHEALGVDD